MQAVADSLEYLEGELHHGLAPDPAPNGGPKKRLVSCSIHVRGQGARSLHGMGLPQNDR